jgi:hypothetical protein
MPTSFGAWLSQRRGARIFLIAGLLPLGLLGILSAAVVVCISGLKGWREAGVDCLLAVSVLTGVTLVMGGEWWQVMISGGSILGVAAWLGGLTGIYGSLALALQAIVVGGLLGIVVFAIVVRDPVMFWEQFLTGFAAQMESLGAELASPEAFLALAPLMSGMVAASVLLSSMAALFIGSWWAGNAGGRKFKAMFVNIRLGYLVGGLALVAGLAALLTSAALAGNALLVLGMGFMLQGLSVLHWHADQRGWPGVYLLPVYLPFMLGAAAMSMAMFVLAAVGFVDNWYGLRRRGADVV